GLVLDYSLLSSASNFTFQADSTYYAAGSVNLSGTTVIEGGTVVKYTNNSSIEIVLGGTIDCRTDFYRPAIFTARDDSTVGELIGTNQLSGYYASTALILHDANHTVHNLRISYAKQGLSLDDGSVTVRHAQFVQCQKAVLVPGCEAYLENVLFYSVSNMVSGNSLQAHGQHLTVNRCTTLADDVNTNGTVGLTNCLLIQMTNWGNSSFSTNYVVTNSDSSVFQTVGAGSHYLATNSIYRNAGTTN